MSSEKEKCYNPFRSRKNVATKILNSISLLMKKHARFALHVGKKYLREDLKIKSGVKPKRLNPTLVNS